MASDTFRLRALPVNGEPEVDKIRTDASKDTGTDWGWVVFLFVISFLLLVLALLLAREHLEMGEFGIGIFIVGMAGIWTWRRASPNVKLVAPKTSVSDDWGDQLMEECGLMKPSPMRTDGTKCDSYRRVPIAGALFRSMFMTRLKGIWITAQANYYAYISRQCANDAIDDAASAVRRLSGPSFEASSALFFLKHSRWALRSGDYYMAFYCAKKSSYASARSLGQDGGPVVDDGRSAIWELV